MYFMLGTMLGLVMGFQVKNCTFRINQFVIIAENLPRQNDTVDIEISSNASSKLIFAGIMTTRNNLRTRALAASTTWTSSIHGDVKFFCGMTCKDSETNTAIKLKILPLTVKEDTYPPQRKSFMMLRYMYENHLDQYEWFVRADDDVYVNGDKLTVFLSSLNSSKLYFIGQPAFGRKYEKRKLGLAKNKPYCMGGPGIVISKGVLARMGPHINHCMNHLHTNHEDTELARCIYKFVGISCIHGKQVSIKQNIIRMTSCFH